MGDDDAVWIRERLNRIENRLEEVGRYLRDHPAGQLESAMARCFEELARVERRVERLQVGFSWSMGVGAAVVFFLGLFGENLRRVLGLE